MNNTQKDIRSRLSYKRVLAITGIVSLLIIYPLLWVRVLSDPAQRTAADFLAFYAAGRISITQGMSKAYNLESQRIAEDDVLNATISQDYISRGLTPPKDFGPALKASEVNPFPHPPFILPLLAVLAHFNYLTAFVLWSLFMLLLIIASSAVLVKTLPRVVGVDRWILFFGIVLSFPAFFSIINGQDSALLFLGAVLWFYGFFRESDLLSGFGLALTTIRPQMAIVLSLPFLFRRRKVWGWFCLLAGSLVLVSIFLVGRSGVSDFLNILKFSANSEGYKFFNENLMVNLIGLLLRTFPSGNPALIRSIGWVGFAASILFLCIVWIKQPAIQEKHFCLAVVIAIFSVPHAHYHDLILLLIPLVGVMRILLGKGLIKIENAVLLPLGLTAVLFLTYLIFPVLKYPILYPLMLLMILMAWFPEKIIFWHKNKEQEVPG